MVEQFVQLKFHDLIKVIIIYDLDEGRTLDAN